MTSNGRSFAEFFAGIGLVRLGLEQAGWRCDFANDIDEKKFNFYSQNFDACDYVVKDIWQVQTSEIPKGIDLFTASFPCVDLSVAGNRKGINAERSGTYWAFIDILKRRKAESDLPRVIMLENVRGFLTSNRGEDVSLAIKALNNLGYITDIFSLDAKYFTPQSRPRVFVIGALEDAIPEGVPLSGGSDIPFEWNARLDFQHPGIRDSQIKKVIFDNPTAKWGVFDIPNPPLRNSTLDTVIEEFELDHSIWWSGDQYEKIINQMKYDHFKVLDAHRASTKPFYGTIYRRKRDTGSMAELRLDGLAGCLRTPKGGSSKQIVARAGNGSISFRWMTPREYARLQGVSDHYKLPDNNTQALFGLGDAVCVPAIRWIGENIINQII